MSATNCLSSFEATLRSVDMDALSPVARKVFDYAFPSFNETPEINPTSRDAFSKGGKVQKPYNYRRFAGGPELPRGSYASVCQDESGWDDGTLVCELTSYADPRRSGEIHVFDNDDPRVTGQDTALLGSFPGYRPALGSIVVAFVSRPNAPHPLLARRAKSFGDSRIFSQFQESAIQNDRGVLLLELPTRLRRIHLENVFDLRRESNQNLLNKWAREGSLFWTFFVYPRPLDGLPGIDLPAVIPQGYPFIWVYPPPTDVPFEYPTNYFCSQALRFDETDACTFRYLLHCLVCPGRGGSPVTEAIGASIRMLGARGLVYPSARNDIYCQCQDDEVVSHSGWCFVDFDACGFPAPAYRVIFYPKLWVGREPLSFGVPPEGWRATECWEIRGLRSRTQKRHTERIEAWYSERKSVIDGLERRWRRFWET